MIRNVDFCDKCGAVLNNKPQEGIQVRFRSSWPDYSLVLCEECFKEFAKIEETFTEARRKLENSNCKELSQHILEKGKRCTGKRL